MKRRTGLLAVVVCLALLVWLAPVLLLGSPQNCTIFTLVSGDEVVYGNNEDWHTDDLVVGFYPAAPGEFGSVHLGYRNSKGQINFQGVVNDQGLAWDVNSLPVSKLNPHPEREFSHAEDNYLSMLSKTCATVEEAIALAERVDFGDSLGIQIHIADATGDAVTVTAGADGELAFFRMNPEKGYLVSTNFNVSNPDNGTRGWRFEEATKLLAEADDRTDDIQTFAGEVLKAVSLNNITTYTLYSNVFDLRNRKIYLYYLSQYDEVVVLDMELELSKGQRIVEMREFFTEETAQAGEKAYRIFEARFRAVQVVVICMAVLLLYFAARTIRGVVRRKGKEGNNDDN